MSNKFFKFKRFTVFHDRCAMKVGTDGVLLGAWTDVDNVRNIVDVGSGSGLIAMMLSQRNESAKIVAIEIDGAAAAQALENIESSPFMENIVVETISFQEFANHSNMKFDSIVSNPPFFTNSLLSPTDSRSKARHAYSLSLEELLFNSKKILTDRGTLSFIYPYSEFELIKKIINDNRWYIHRQTDIYPKKESQYPKRVLLELALYPPLEFVSIDKLVIEVERHKYSEEYISLTKDYYLKM